MKKILFLVLTLSVSLFMVSCKADIKSQYNDNNSFEVRFKSAVIEKSFIEHSESDVFSFNYNKRRKTAILRSGEAFYEYYDVTENRLISSDNCLCLQNEKVRFQIYNHEGNYDMNMYYSVGEDWVLIASFSAETHTYEDPISSVTMLPLILVAICFVFVVGMVMKFINKWQENEDSIARPLYRRRSFYVIIITLIAIIFIFVSNNLYKLVKPKKIIPIQIEAVVVSADSTAHNSRLKEKPDEIIYVTGQGNEEYVSIREHKNNGSQELGRLYNDERADFISSDGTWYKVKYGDIVGYVYARFSLIITEPNP